MTIEEKNEILREYSRHDGDTGSPEVLIAIFTKRINDINEHLKVNSDDHNARRSLLMMVNNRRALLNSLRDADFERYRILIAKLGLRK